MQVTSVEMDGRMDALRALGKTATAQAASLRGREMELELAERRLRQLRRDARNLKRENKKLTGERRYLKQRLGEAEAARQGLEQDLQQLATENAAAAAATTAEEREKAVALKTKLNEALETVAHVRRELGEKEEELGELRREVEEKEGEALELRVELDQKGASFSCFCTVLRHVSIVATFVCSVACPWARSLEQNGALPVQSGPLLFYLPAVPTVGWTHPPLERDASLSTHPELDQAP